MAAVDSLDRTRLEIRLTWVTRLIRHGSVLQVGIFMAGFQQCLSIAN